MFFRRQKPTVPAFEDRLQDLRRTGFEVTPEGAVKARVRRGICAARIEDEQAGKVKLETPGIVVGDEIGLLTDLGYQKVFTTPGGIRTAALASQLKALHDFTEDLRAALGIESLFNESLGTVNELHLYDRVRDRDSGTPKRPWES